MFFGMPAEEALLIQFGTINQSSLCREATPDGCRPPGIPVILLTGELPGPAYHCPPVFSLLLTGAAHTKFSKSGDHRLAAEPLARGIGNRRGQVPEPGFPGKGQSSPRV